jgi:hypothetical protein
MFDPQSRYARQPEAVYQAPDGTPIRYLTRRFVARSEEPALATYSDVKVRARVDLLAVRLLGDPLAFWRVCDAAVALDPLSLVEGERVLVGGTLLTGGDR